MLPTLGLTLSPIVSHRDGRPGPLFLSLVVPARGVNAVITRLEPRWLSLHGVMDMALSRISFSSDGGGDGLSASPVRPSWVFLYVQGHLRRPHPSRRLTP